jgi:hypothetical protein
LLKRVLLKETRDFVDTLDSMITIKLLDNTVQELAPEQVRCLLPYRGVFAHKSLRNAGIFYFRGEVVSLQGPLPAGDADDVWILHLGTYGQVIQGLPIFEEDAESVAGLEAA